MPTTGERAYFDVHPSVVYQLGESLISDAVQALIELVKNCYDADASYAKVVIDTSGAAEVPGTLLYGGGGRVIVEDDGHGMSEDAVTEGWLLISNRAKRELKEARATTPGGRTPLGDKGLGRLGVQRLGESLDVFSKASGAAGVHFAFSWLDFATAAKLSDVDVRLEPWSSARKHGTTVVVSELREPELWQGGDAVKRLSQELSRMISPYKAIRDFVVTIEANGQEIELTEVSERVRQLAPIRYKINFDGLTIRFSGRARLDFFRPDNEKDAEEFALIVESDHGKQLFQFLDGQKEASRFHLRRAEGEKWFVEFEISRAFDDLAGLEKDPANAAKLANPGRFSGEVDSFNLGRAAYRQQSVFDAISEYRSHIKDLSGIRVYRDGFAIRVDQDWLGLGGQWTSARSYYGLKPDNTLGYIALSARENMQLEETTDREGFKDTAHYRNFFTILSAFREFTTDLHTFFGRCWVDFRKLRNEQLARIETRKSVEDISRSIRETIGSATDQQAALEKFSGRFEAGVTRSRDVLRKLVEIERVTPAMQERAKETLETLAALLADASQVMAHAAQYLGTLAGVKNIGRVLEDRVDSLRRQVDDMYETVALGITAEAIAHEVFQIAEGLSSRTKRARARLNGSTDKVIGAYLEYVQAATRALRKQVSFLSPALRYVRDQREEINVRAFVTELQSFYEDRLAKNSILMVPSFISDDPFAVRMNRGKLTQIIDNFVINSEYWLKEDMRVGRVEAGEITIEVERPFIRVFDNGRGIDPALESALFEPFVTAKPRGVGRGLGMFIVKQLLDAEGCHVGLIPQRNRFRRLYKFQIDLRGALNA